MSFEFRNRRPTQHLNIHCSRCGIVTVRFESWVAEGNVFEMVGHKLSEMMAFLSINNSQVLCTPCAALAASEAEDRRLREKNRIRQQLEPIASQAAQFSSEEPAIYDDEGITSLRVRQEDQTESTGNGSLPRRANTQRARTVSHRYYDIFSRL